jgi:pimeloyl-ACP methyl ester carboxylesterase
MTAIVLLPGLDGTGTLFADFIAALGKDFSPIVVSYPNDQDLNYHALEEWVRARLPVNQAYLLLGESFSGPIAVSIAASHPPGLIGVILSCSFVRNPVPAFHPLKRTLGLLPVKNKLTISVFARLLAGKSSARVRKEMRQALEHVAAHTVRTRLRAVLETDYSDKLKQINVPILYLKASQDRVVPARAIRHILALVPSVQVVTFKGPHLLLQALPDEVATIVRNFSVQLTSNHQETDSKAR